MLFITGFITIFVDSSAFASEPELWGLLGLSAVFIGCLVILVKGDE